jgi:hypothetical protein
MTLSAAEAHVQYLVCVMLTGRTEKRISMMEAIIVESKDV